MSNTTDNSIKKPADGMDSMEAVSLPEYGMRPIDTWRVNHEQNHNVGFDSLDGADSDLHKVILIIQCDSNSGGNSQFIIIQCQRS